MTLKKVETHNLNAYQHVKEFVIENGCVLISTYVSDMYWVQFVPYLFRGKFSKKGDLTDVSKPLKSEKKREDALANIDLSNIAGIVIINHI